MSMQLSKIPEYARALYNAHGDRAEAEAAQKALDFEQKGDMEQAEDWQAIRRAIKEIRGARQS